MQQRAPQMWGLRLQVLPQEAYRPGMPQHEAHRLQHEHPQQEH